MARQHTPAPASAAGDRAGVAWLLESPCDTSRAAAAARQGGARSGEKNRRGRQYYGEGDMAEIQRWGDIEVDGDGRRALVRGAPLALTPTELALLAVLIAAAGRVVTRRELLERVFATRHEGYARNVDCHVTRLRRKLEAAGLSPAPIHGVRGAGYRLNLY